VSTEIKAPQFPESIADGTIAAWHKKPGEAVSRDELLAEIETDKVVIEIVAPADGTLDEIVKNEGDTVLSEEVIGKLTEGAAPASKAKAEDSKQSVAKAQAGTEDGAKAGEAGTDGEAAGGAPSPSARKLAEEQGVDLASVKGSGKDGRITKEDVAKAVAARADAPVATASSPAELTEASTPAEVAAGERVERRVPMTRLRASIAKRLVEAQHNTAMLTTFNEVNMAPIMALRSKYRDQFEKRHNGTKLGFMSFFVRASVEALKRFPGVNASIDGNDIIYHGYYDIGVAVSTDRGLVVPVIRDADALGLAQIEQQVADYGRKARDGKLSLEEMSGGTFTISNGGIFGSLLSTPILNPPQTGILGMHKIQERPVVENGEIVVRPMMYLALSYDHRLIDGQEAVRFLVTIKEMLEEPARILLDL
jgi:2-oxoglutarate dehydrogenase E2 component (dihydrolipoamide succinyltransferase)